MTEEEYEIYWNLPKEEKKIIYERELKKITDKHPEIFYRDIKDA